MLHTVHCAAETEAFGSELACRFLQQGKKRVFFALFGEMGVGKTALTRGIASALGYRNVHSPTYTIVNEHRGGEVPFFHFDMYRLQGEDDLASIGFWDYLAQDGWCVCEWSERIPDELPADALRITISRDPASETTRIIHVEEPV